MSNSGPAPCAYRNSGSGCHWSGPGTWNIVVAVSGVPMSPRAMARIAVWMPAPSTVSGAVAYRTPAADAAARSAWASSAVVATGFSLQVCLPAAMICWPTLACSAGIVMLTTIEMSSRARSSSTVPDAGTPYFSACEAARSRMRSATIRTSTSANCVRLVRYWSEMLPAR